MQNRLWLLTPDGLTAARG